MVDVNLLSALSEEFAKININTFLINLIFAIILLVIGIVFGKVVRYILKKLIDKIGTERISRKSFIDLLFTVIAWSIYLLFISLALKQLKIPALTTWLTSILLFIPALVSSLILISIGFALAVYLRDLIEESEILGWKVLSNLLFYFVLYIFVVYSLKISLISLEPLISNIIILLFTLIGGSAVAYAIIKKEKILMSK